MTQVKLIKINSNLKNNQTIVTLAFKYGYLKETNKKYGYCHLAEHYICSLLEEKFGLKEVYGSVDNDYILINIELNKKDADNFIADKLGTLVEELIKSEIHTKVLKNEKGRLISEINNTYLNIDNEIFEEISNKIIKKPEKISRRKIDQISNVKKLDKSELKKTIKKILHSPTIIFIDNKENDKLHKIKKSDIFIEDTEVNFVKAKKIKIEIKNSYYKNNYNQFLFFKGLDHKSTTRDKFSLRFILQESSAQLKKVLIKEGVYETYYDNYILNNYGFFWFLVSFNKKNNLNLKNDLFIVIESIINNEKLETKLNKFKKEQIKNIKDSWKIEEHRNPWIIEDLLETGKVSDSETLEKEILKISKKELNRVKKELLKEDDVYILENK